MKIYWTIQRKHSTPSHVVKHYMLRKNTYATVVAIYQPFNHIYHELSTQCKLTTWRTYAYDGINQLKFNFSIKQVGHWCKPKYRNTYPLTCEPSFHHHHHNLYICEHVLYAMLTGVWISRTHLVMALANQSNWYIALIYTINSFRLNNLNQPLL